jgi:thioredoxin 1
MKTACLTRIAALLLFPQIAVCAYATPQQARANKTSERVSSFAFEPLDRWKAAVLSGDRAAIAAFYTTSPPSRSKTPEGESQNPAEEPEFWSTLRHDGLDRLDVKVLEAKAVQPGVMALVLRFEAGIRTSSGEKPGVVSGAQIWVQRLGEWRIISTQRSGFLEKENMRLPEPAKPNTNLYPDPARAPTEISSALATAAKDHKRVLLVFGGNWCYDCHVLDATFHSKAIAPLVVANYHVVHVNVGDYDKNLDLAKKYEIPLDKGVPSLAILDPDGKLVISQKQGEFESTVRLGPEDVVEFLKKWKPQRPSS